LTRLGTPPGLAQGEIIGFVEEAELIDMVDGVVVEDVIMRNGSRTGRMIIVGVSTKVGEQ
jgi:hypothetical protein